MFDEDLDLLAVTMIHGGASAPLQQSPTTFGSTPARVTEVARQCVAAGRERR